MLRVGHNLGALTMRIRAGRNCQAEGGGLGGVGAVS